MSNIARISEYREELTNRIVAELEKGQIPWQRPWQTAHNPVSGTVYNGVNRLNLAIIAVNKGYDDPRWCTYKQANTEGWQVKAGEKASYIEHWQWTEQRKVFDEQGKPVMGDDGKQTTETVKLEKPICNVYAIFNAKQIEGMPPLEAKEFKAVETAERILANSGAEITYTGTRAFYSLEADNITLPARNLFKSEELFYGTALHELAHWTGHESRLNRDMSGGFGSPNYAKEELRAEIASCFVNHEIGTTTEYSNTAAYVQDWITVLKNDKNEIFHAASDAHKISNYILEFGKEKELTQEETALKQPSENLIAKVDIKLSVPLEDRATAKELGAQWDKEAKSWFIPKGMATNAFQRDNWLPADGVLPALKDTPLYVPFEEREVAKATKAIAWRDNIKLWVLKAGANSLAVPDRFYEPQRQHTITKTFEEFAAEKGLIIRGEAVADGELHRVPVEGGKPRARDGAYVLHDDANGRSGYVQNFKTGEKATFGEKSADKVLTPKTIEEIEQAKAKRNGEIKKTQDAAAQKAEYLVGKFATAKEHAYLQKKGVQPHGTLIDTNGTLIVPLQNINGEIRSFQRVNEDSTKNYLTGGQKQGCFHSIGDISSPKTILICEGFATGASLHEATKQPVVCAMDTSNMKNIALAMREKYGDKLEIIIAGDNDHKTANNPGKHFAEEAAKAVNGKAVIPQFTKAQMDKGYTDFNDLATDSRFAVRKQICAAMEKTEKDITCKQNDKDIAL